MINGIAKFIAALNGNIKRGQIAAGFAWGLLFGLIPAGNFFWIVFFLISFCFRHHHGSKILVMAIVKVLLFAILPLTDALGWEVLHIESLIPLYTTLYNMPFVPFTKFNNTLVAGGIVAGLALWFPVYFLVRGLIPAYRKSWAPKLRNSRLVKSINQLPLVNSLLGAVRKFSSIDGFLG